jgi:hypothetical protein
MTLAQPRPDLRTALDNIRASAVVLSIAAPGSPGYRIANARLAHTMLLAAELGASSADVLDAAQMNGVDQ